ncbi:TonB-dependent receptor plug domain-containing protein [Gloeobacter morelensis]|uniref:TonB-dependent receptor n=1 Tax=Gloeobacter morelensis MG652769 TaxID=2781736 RepID=A0ABY3PIP1_9CYAN|nr:TonB-dependent receptor [Gloeobacter morelensis]UFP93494.1 TonB-dependent receptor [Gloeobacter morelensis MG652769]
MSGLRVDALVLGCAFSVLIAAAAAEPLPPVSTRAGDLAPAEWNRIAQAAGPQVAPSQPVAQQASETEADPKDKPIDLDEVTVTGTGRAQRQSETTTPIYIIDQKEIEQKGSRTLGDAIRNVPGVTTNIFGAGSDVHNGYFIRGVPTTSTAILIDGRPITNLNQEHYDPSEIPINNVERIEVMPSGGTTLYGSTALGGVINVITRKPTRPLEGQLSVEFGSYGYSKYGAYYQGKSGPVTYNFNYENFNTLNNFFYRVERPVGILSGTRPNGDFNSRSYNLDVGYEIDARNTITLNTYLRNFAKGISPFSIVDTRQNVFNGQSAEQLGLNDDHQSRLLTDTWGIGLTWDSKLGQGNDSNLQFRVSVDRALNRELDRIGDDFSTEIYLLGLRGSHAWQVSRGWGITYGFDYLREIGRSGVTSLVTGASTTDYDTSLDRPALFFLNDFKLASNVTLTAGARYSITSQFGNSFDPNIGVRWQVAPNFALRANFNQGFKAPNFHDLFGKTVHKGNPNLLPERGSFFDAGIDWQPTSTTNLRFTTFIANISNLMSLNLADPRFADFAYFQSLGYVFNDRVRVNYPSVYNTGFEMGFNWRMAPSWEFFLTNTYTDSRVVEGLRPEINQTQQALVPFLMGRAGFSYEDPNGFRAAVFANVVGGRSVDTYHVGPGDAEVFDPAGNPIFISHIAKLPPGSLLPGYTTVDLSLRVPVAQAIVFNAYIDNLLNTYYERSYGGPAPGTNFRVGLKTTF